MGTASFLESLDRLALTTKIGVFVTLWLAVYSLVTLLVFHNWEDVGDLGKRGPAARVPSSGGGGSLFDAVGASLSHAVGAGGYAHSHIGDSITSYDFFVDRMSWLSKDMRSDMFLVTNPFLTDTCAARYGNIFSKAEQIRATKVADCAKTALLRPDILELASDVLRNTMFNLVQEASYEEFSIDAEPLKYMIKK